MRKLNIFILVIASLTGLSACDDLFDLEQDDVIFGEENYQKSYDALGSILGIYQSWQDACQTIFLSNSLRGDLVVTTDNAPSEFKEIEVSILNEENQYLQPLQFYKIINQANDVFANLDKLQANDASVDEVQRTKYEAELTYLRTSAYLFLLRTFDEVVYYEESLIDVNQVFEYTPMSRTEVMDTLVAQMEEYVGVWDIVTVDGWYRTRFTNYPPYQILADLYLEQGNWEKAELYARKVMDNHTNEHFQVADDFKNDKWVNIFGRDEASRETLWYIGFSKSNNEINPLQKWCSHGADGVYYIKPSDISVSYWTRDKTAGKEGGDIYRGEGSSYVEFAPGEYAIEKWQLNVDPFDYDSKFIIWRAASSWFTWAEAVNRQGRADEAWDAINKGYVDGNKSAINGRLGVRGRVNMWRYQLDEWLPQDVTPTNQDSIYAVEEFLLQEKAREFAFEGCRFADLVRSANWRAEQGLDPEGNWLATKVSEKFLTEPAKQTQVYHQLLDKNNWYISSY